jgi:hypothetical protein
MGMTPDKVEITKDGATTTVVKSAFEKVWKAKGWSVVEESTEAPEAPSGDDKDDNTDV